MAIDPLERNFFTDPEINREPGLYYAALRERGPVFREPYHGIFLVSTLDEILQVYSDHGTFSAVIAAVGPVKLPEPTEGETLAEVIERRRDEIPLSQLLATIDPPRHGRHRALLDRLLTPNRLKENEEFMRSLADELIDEFVDRGEIDFCEAYAGPFTLLVIADLLGVPREEHERFRGWQEGNRQAVFLHLDPYFTRYVEDRRASPRDDVITKLATVRFPDGELPAVLDVVRIASFLFAAGQETTAHLLASGMRILAEQPALADELRAKPEAIPNFVEECLRFESPIRGAFRLALRDTKLGGVDIPAGSAVMAMNGAASRDPSLFDDPDRFDAKRENARRHVAFGHGEHFCPGASLARAEARISFERLLARMDDLELVDPSALSYLPYFVLRGLESLPLRFGRRP